MCKRQPGPLRSMSGAEQAVLCIPRPRSRKPHRRHRRNASPLCPFDKWGEVCYVTF